MRYLAIALALLLALCVAPAQAQPAPLAVSATYAADGALVVTWPAVAGAVASCVVTAVGAPGCVYGGAASWRQKPYDRDAALFIKPGQVLEVQAWGAEPGELLAVGRATVTAHRVALPQLWR